MAETLNYLVHRYGAHELQHIGVWDVDIEDKSKSKYWIIYIHGGAWRDPRISHQTFAPIISRIVQPQTNPPPSTHPHPNPSTPNSTSLSPSRSTSAPTSSHANPAPSNANANPTPAIAFIAAFASLDYRLSPHPSFPQDPATTPARRFRGARHPDHLRDVRAAIAFLQRRYGFGDRYVLAGHSCGGFMAYQVLLGAEFAAGGEGEWEGGEEAEEEEGWEIIASPSPSPSLTPPQAVFGIEGIYDLAGLNARFQDSYTEFLSGAFGPPSPSWDAVSPMKCASSRRYGDLFPGGLAVLGHSPDDELVDMPEADGMAARLRRDGVKEVWLDKGLKGTHDGVWGDGREVARVVGRILEVLRAREGMKGADRPT